MYYCIHVLATSTEERGLILDQIRVNLLCYTFSVCDHA